MYLLTLANEAIQFQDSDDSVELYFLQFKSWLKTACGV